MKNILSKLQIIQTKLKAPKGQRNSFGNYNYRNCEDILEAVKPILAETKTVLRLEDEIVTVGGRNYVQAIATLFDIESEESIYGKAFAREEETKKGMDGSQITGASSSYARKYALNGLFAIDDTKDSDTTNTNNNDTKNKLDKDVSKKTLQERINFLQSELEKTNRLKSTLNYYKVDSIEKLDEDTVDSLLARLGQL